MVNPCSEQVLKLFKLNENQRLAAIDRERDVVVTAGAGSGKTLTLVARYVSLLAEGVSPRRIAAITFTKKAAREMRSRVRGKLIELQTIAETEDERQKWLQLSAQMDSARIGTIHSLCTEILKAHPAEAGIDPRFEVLDEGLAAALKIQAVDDTLKMLVEQENFLPLLANISLNNLTQILQTLLENRLEAGETFGRSVEIRSRLIHELKKRMNSERLGDFILDLRSMSDYELTADAGEKLAEMVKDLLELWTAAERAISDNDPIGCAVYLYKARREKMSRKSGKAGAVKEIIAALQENYDELLNPLVGGKSSQDPLPTVDSEILFEQLLPVLRGAFEVVNQTYKDLVESRQALDFDDLEYGAQMLLRREGIRAVWQGELDAVLVDEFQDTNQRQREIVEALTRDAGSLFIVGDMRQSIYRFRRADVTVFRKEQERIKRNGGLLVELDRTYRAHEPLLAATGDLLTGVIGTTPDPYRPYYIPYTPLIANDPNPPQGIKPPHVEFIFGAGEDTETARPLAARALAERLLQLKQENQINTWDEVALLFRASTGFAVYEETLEEAGIPFVTVAGRGFYERPEIRDLVNILRTLSDPLDDLSFAGLLRSPAFGVSDAGLYLLRQNGQSYWESIQGDLSHLSEKDRLNVERTRQILGNLLPLVDRVSVAELLKCVVDLTDYRALLASADMFGKPSNESGGRLWRNLDKLLDDAQASKQISLRDFLDMLKTLNEAGAREGEAPAEAQGTVRLMTIHKAKGLEFNVVVLADASRQVRAPSELIYLSDDLGAAIKLEPPPMLYNLAKGVDKDQDGCEEFRLLYVALTRAKVKLLISAHAKQDEEGNIKLSAWADALVTAAGLHPYELVKAEGTPFEFCTLSNLPVRVWCPLEGSINFTTTTPVISQAQLPEGNLQPLYKPIIDDQRNERDSDAEEIIDPLTWRATAQDDRVPGYVLGSMVHKAIQRWMFPDNQNLIPLLETEAFNSGIASDKQRQTAISRAVELLERLRRHPICVEIERAVERQSELPYSYLVEGKVENRVIDLLYRNEDGWQIVDIKTDHITSIIQKHELMELYCHQIQRYKTAINTLLNIDARSFICFLDYQGKVAIEEV